MTDHTGWHEAADFERFCQEQGTDPAYARNTVNRFFDHMDKGSTRRDAVGCPDQGTLQ